MSYRKETTSWMSLSTGVYDMQFRVFESRFITVKRAAVERVTKCEKEGLCCGCLRPVDPLAARRGLCGGCYHATRRAINSGKTTEQKQMADGRMLESKPSGRKPSNPVSVDVDK